MEKMTSANEDQIHFKLAILGFLRDSYRYGGYYWKQLKGSVATSKDGL